MRLAILGAGGHGRVVAESAAALGWSISFFDDDRTGDVDGWPIIGNSVVLTVKAVGFDGVIVGIGTNRLRLEWMDRLAVAGAQLATIIDATSYVSRSASLGQGSFLAPGSIVGVGATLGAGCIINTSASVDHDCCLADGVHLSPGARLSGAVTIGQASWLGTGSAVRNNVVIGRDVIVGVGGVVIGDIGDDQTVIGVPARPMEKS